MSVPPVDLGKLNEFDAPDVVSRAFRRFRIWLALLLVFVAVAAGVAGYSVDKTRTADLRDLLRRADALQTQATDDPLPYIRMHGDFAAAAGVEFCSEFALRMTQRFLPPQWRFNAEDVAAVRRGDAVAAVRLQRPGIGAVRWQC